MVAKRPKVGLGVFVTSPDHPGCILLGKRKGSAGAGTWALPGGHLEFGEEWAECAAREVLEETGLEIENIKFLTANNAVDIQTDYHYVVIYMYGEPKGTSEARNMEPEKCEGWHWVEWQSQDFPSPTFLPLRLTSDGWEVWAGFGLGGGGPAGASAVLVDMYEGHYDYRNQLQRAVGMYLISGFVGFIGEGNPKV